MQQPHNTSTLPPNRGAKIDLPFFALQRAVCTQKSRHNAIRAAREAANGTARLVPSPLRFNCSETDARCCRAAQARPAGGTRLAAAAGTAAGSCVRVHMAVRAPSAIARGAGPGAILRLWPRQERLPPSPAAAAADAAAPADAAPLLASTHRDCRAQNRKLQMKLKPNECMTMSVPAGQETDGAMRTAHPASVHSSCMHEIALTNHTSTQRHNMTFLLG